MSSFFDGGGGGTGVGGAGGGTTSRNPEDGNNNDDFMFDDSDIDEFSMHSTPDDDDDDEQEQEQQQQQSVDNRSISSNDPLAISSSHQSIHQVFSAKHCYQFDYECLLGEDKLFQLRFIPLLKLVGEFLGLEHQWDDCLVGLLLHDWNSEQLIEKHLSSSLTTATTSNAKLCIAKPGFVCGICFREYEQDVSAQTADNWDHHASNDHCSTLTTQVNNAMNDRNWFLEDSNANPQVSSIENPVPSVHDGFIDDDDDDDDDEHSASSMKASPSSKSPRALYYFDSGCGHGFCLDCYRFYLMGKFIDESECKNICCAEQKCNQPIGYRWIRWLLNGGNDKCFETTNVAQDKKAFNMYKRLLMSSFVQDQTIYQWCPYADCKWVAEMDSMSAGGRKAGGGEVARRYMHRQLMKRIPCINCPENHVFCFGCLLQDNHQPAPCELVRLWLKKCADDSETANWISANTKECTRCRSTIEKNGGCNHMTCKQCKYEFCWVCLGPWSEHGTNWYQCNRFDEHSSREARDSQSKSRAALERYLHHFQRFANHQQSARLANEFQKRMQQKMDDLQMIGISTANSARSGDNISAEPSASSESASQLMDNAVPQAGFSWIEVQFLGRALEVVLECRQVLQWTYPFAYYLAKNPTDNWVEIFGDNQRDLEVAVEQLNELIEQPLPGSQNEAGVEELKQQPIAFNRNSSSTGHSGRLPDSKNRAKQANSREVNSSGHSSSSNQSSSFAETRGGKRQRNSESATTSHPAPAPSSLSPSTAQDKPQQSLAQQMQSLRQQILDKTEYCSRRRHILLQDCAQGLIDGKWNFLVDLETGKSLMDDEMITVGDGAAPASQNNQA